MSIPFPDLPPAPCDTCELAPVCREQHIACRAFHHYVGMPLHMTRNLTRNEHDLPTAGVYRRIYHVDAPERP